MSQNFRSSDFKYDSLFLSRIVSRSWPAVANVCTAKEAMMHELNGCSFVPVRLRERRVGASLELVE